MSSSQPFVSVIVPVLNEAILLGDFLRNVRDLGPRFEIIVVDGGSSDRTISIAQSFADRVITAPRGRASQMNAGAEIARGEVLWFLHADLNVPRNSIAQIRAALADAQIAGGCFRLRYPRRESIYRVSDSVGNLGVHLFGFALGDHGIFCRREAFVSAGGYPDVPILEDAELYRRLKRIGRMRQVGERIVSDPRTFERCGRYRTTIVYFLILALYVGGVPIAWLNRIYCRFHSGRRDTHAAANGAGYSSYAA
jgi:rSAM/selenodomain-associated transferase 2